MSAQAIYVRRLRPVPRQSDTGSGRLGDERCTARDQSRPSRRWPDLVVLMAQINDAEPVIVGIFQHDEVRILRVHVPIDAPGSE
jgi:hypothetical protein